jgi:hypothetical protein
MTKIENMKEENQPLEKNKSVLPKVKRTTRKVQYAKATINDSTVIFEIDAEDLKSLQYTIWLRERNAISENSKNKFFEKMLEKLVKQKKETEFFDFGIWYGSCDEDQAS